MALCYIGLGSNIGNRAHYLSAATRYLSSHRSITLLRCSPVYETPALLPDNAPASWDIAFLNQVIALETLISPHALLDVMKQCEAHLGRQERGHWGPREIDCDILLYQGVSLEEDTLKLPHPRMIERSFVMRPLADIAPDIMLHQKTLAHWLAALPQDSALSLYSAPRTQLVGIVNVTPDSFSDGGEYDTTEKAMQRIHDLVHQGADVIDIGAESTRPTATPLTQSEEWSRLRPVLDSIRSHYSSRVWKLSVDTYHLKTALAALGYKVDWVNDVTGFTQNEMLAAVADSGATVVAMHSLGVPARPDITLSAQSDAVSEIIAWAHASVNRLTAVGIARERIILDPGIGFGKNAHQSLMLIHNAHRLTDVFPDINWLYGHSRKSYQKLLGATEMLHRDLITCAHSAQLMDAGIAYIRVHDVMAHALMRDAVYG